MLGRLSPPPPRVGGGGGGVKCRLMMFKLALLVFWHQIKELFFPVHYVCNNSAIVLKYNMNPRQGKKV